MSWLVHLSETGSRLRLKRLRAEPPLVREPPTSQGHLIEGLCDFIGRNSST